MADNDAEPPSSDTMLEGDEILRDIIAALPPEERKFATLTFFEHKSAGEIAAMTGMSLVAADRRVRRAKKRVYAAYAPYVQPIPFDEEDEELPSMSEVSDTGVSDEEFLERFWRRVADEKELARYRRKRALLIGAGVLLAAGCVVAWRLM